MRETPDRDGEQAGAPSLGPAVHHADHAPDPFAAQTTPLPGRRRELDTGPRLGWGFAIVVCGALAGSAISGALIGATVAFAGVDPADAGGMWPSVATAIAVAIGVCVSFRRFTGLRLNPFMPLLVSLLGALGIQFVAEPAMKVLVPVLAVFVLGAWSGGQIRMRPKAGTSLSDGAPGGIIFRSRGAGRPAPVRPAPVAEPGPGPGPGAPPPFVG